MILFIIILIITIIITEIRLNDYDWNVTGVLMGLFMGVMIGGLIAIVVTVVPTFWLQSQNTCVNNQKYNLISLRDSIGIQGAFFIGSGYINNTLSYFYYQQMPDGGYQANSLDMSQAEVYQDEQKHPYIQSYNITFKNPLLNYILIPNVVWSCQSALHIPKNSILQNYSLNLGK